MKRKIIAANWKMNTDYVTGLSLFSEILALAKSERVNNQEIIVCAPFILLNSLTQLTKNSKTVSIGAQNCHQAEAGAFTGEISTAMIKSVGASYVIVGHSERRHYFGEDNYVLSEKVNSAIKHELVPIFCVGETLEQRSSNTHFQTIKQQLEQGLFHLIPEKFKDKVIIAYEPVWAIGTGVTATPEQAQEMHSFIRKELTVKYGLEIAADTPLLYGGSCNSKNAPQLFTQTDINGGLIGGASLKAREFIDIMKALN